MSEPINIFVVSDATGHTAESVLTAVLVQFRGAQFNIRRFSFTRTAEQLENIIQLAPEGRCIIVFTLVSDHLREILCKRGEARNLTLIDVMGPLINIFKVLLQHSPQMKPGMLRHANAADYQITEAIHFTLTHDDGQRLDTLDQADLIIFGVSRTGKTPTSIFLSCRKLKVANVPIIKDMPVPQSIIQLPVKKVGFRMNIDRLIQLRAERVGQMSYAAMPGYSTPSHILEEVEFCEQTYRKIPNLWTIDVTIRSIEETSEWIVRNVL